MGSGWEAFASWWLLGVAGWRFRGCSLSRLLVWMVGGYTLGSVVCSKNIWWVGLAGSPMSTVCFLPCTQYLSVGGWRRGRDSNPRGV